jgi:hypothetical protein
VSDCQPPELRGDPVDVAMDTATDEPVPCIQIDTPLSPPDLAVHSQDEVLMSDVVLGLATPVSTQPRNHNQPLSGHASIPGKLLATQSRPESNEQQILGSSEDAHRPSQRNPRATKSVSGNDSCDCLSSNCYTMRCITMKQPSWCLRTRACSAPWQHRTFPCPLLPHLHRKHVVPRGATIRVCDVVMPLYRRMKIPRNNDLTSSTNTHARHTQTLIPLFESEYYIQYHHLSCVLSPMKCWPLLIDMQIRAEAKTYNILPHSQNGFRVNYRTRNKIL